MTKVERKGSIIANDERVILDTIVERVSAHSEVEKIILFGSRASGSLSQDSNYDICVIIDNDHDNRKTYIDLMKDIASPFFSIDLLVMNKNEYEKKLKEGWSVLQAIQNEGKVLYAA